VYKIPTLAENAQCYGVGFGHQHHPVDPESVSLPDISHDEALGLGLGGGAIHP
jgi:hypothetical protein